MQEGIKEHIEKDKDSIMLRLWSFTLNVTV